MLAVTKSSEASISESPLSETTNLRRDVPTFPSVFETSITDAMAGCRRS
jgi:hypothetical protein